MADKPHFVFRDGMTADRDYVQWITDIKNRYRNSQIKAAIKQFALDMRNAFPEAKGFSYSNVKDMKRWYLFYYEQVIKGHQDGDQIDVTERSRQLADQLEMPELFGQIPWVLYSSC